MKLLVRWLVNAISLVIVAQIVPGFELHGFGAALIAALVVGFVNATLGLFFKIITFPLTLLTLGFFLIVINAIMLEVAAAFTPGFHIYGLRAALVGAVCLSIISAILHWLVKDKPRERYSERY